MPAARTAAGTGSRSCSAAWPASAEAPRPRRNAKPRWPRPPARRWPPRRAGPGSEPALPGLAHQVLPEGIVRLAGLHRESARCVNRARRRQVVLRPERDLAVARGPRESNALIDEAAAQPEAARLATQDQQAQLCHRVRLAHQEHATGALAVHFGDPGMLALRVEVTHELRRD